MHYAGVSYPARFMTALRFMFYHQVAEMHCNSSADALVDDFRSWFFFPFLSLYQRQITACHQRRFPLLFFHNVSMRSPQNDSALSGDLWGMQQRADDLSFTPTCGTRRRFLLKAPLASKCDSSRSILIRPERLIVTACHVNCDHHSEPWSCHVCQVGGKTPTPVWVRSLKPERNLPLSANKARIDQPWRRHWQLIREGTSFHGYGNWSGFRTDQRWSPIWDVVNCNHFTHKYTIETNQSRILWATMVMEYWV